MTQHTPEPWELDSAGWPLIINGPDIGESNCIATIECSESGSRFHYTEEMAVANARLMKAAPKLLAALRAIVIPDNGREIEFDSRREYYKAYIEGGELERAHAAIAEAEGSTFWER